MGAPSPAAAAQPQAAFRPPLVSPNDGGTPNAMQMSLMTLLIE